MASALEAVLRLKADEAARQQQASDNLTQGLQMLSQVVQSNRQMQLDRLRLAQQQSQFDVSNRTELASKGLKMGADGSLARDESLLSETDKILQKGKLAEAARNLGDRNLFNSITGNSSNSSNKSSVEPLTEDAQLYEQANQIDEFTQKPTAQADQAKAILAENAAAKTNSLKAEKELNRKQGVLLRVGKRIVDEYGKTEPSENRIAQVMSIPGSVLQMTKGQKQDATYRSFVTSLKAQLARGQGEVGNLSQSEQQVVLDAVGSLGDTKTVGYEKMINYFKNIAEVSTDPATRKEAIGILDKLTRIKEGNVNPATPQEAEKEVFRAKADTTPLGIMAKALRNTVNPMVNGATMGYLDSASNKVGANPSERFVSPDVQMRGLSEMVGGSASFMAATKILNTVKTIKGVEAINDLSKMKPIEVMDKTVKTAREQIKTGYIKREHDIYVNAIDKIKASDVKVKNADALLDQFALKNKDELGNFKTTDLKNAYDDLVKANKNGGLTEKQLHDAIVSLKGKFKDVVDSAKAKNLSGVQDLTAGYSEAAQNVIKPANLRYSQFKPIERDINEMIGLYGKKTGGKSTDSVVNKILNTDFNNNINQANILKKIGQETGTDLLGTANYYGGKFRAANAVNPNFFGVNIRKIGGGIKDIIKGKPKPVAPVESESMKIIEGIKKGKKQ